MKSVVRYDDIVNFDRMKAVYQRIRVKTKHRNKLVRFELFFTCNLISIYEMLKNRSYRHSSYNIFLISEPKYRVIMSENMSDKVVNHLLSEFVLVPVIEPRLIEMNVATRVSKGTKAGVFYVKKYINYLKDKYDKFYVLKCDIFKYFYSIDHELLLKKLEKIIDDQEIIELLREIVNSTDCQYVNMVLDDLIVKERKRLLALKCDDYVHRIKELDRIPRYVRGKGLPIGNVTSQIMAIFYLNDLDHFIKEVLKIKFYVRYMDDFILFHPDRNYLKFCLGEIEKKLEELKLRLNDKTQIYEIHHGFPFLGYKFVLKEKRLKILLNGQTKRRIKKRIKYCKNHSVSNYTAIKASYKGYLKQSNVKGFERKMDW